VLGTTLACGTPGPLHVGAIGVMTFREWPGLTIDTLREAMRICGFGKIDPEFLETVLTGVERFVDQHGPQLMTADKVGDLLQVTAEERHFAKITTIAAVDETRAERAERRRVEKAEKIRAERNRKPRAAYEAESISRERPWEELGISRRTWYRRQTMSRPMSHDVTFGTSVCLANIPKGAGHTVVPPGLPILTEPCDGPPDFLPLIGPGGRGALSARGPVPAVGGA
jgi:hypothetical protein